MTAFQDLGWEGIHEPYSDSEDCFRRWLMFGQDHTQACAPQLLTEQQPRQSATSLTPTLNKRKVTIKQEEDSQPSKRPCADRSSGSLPSLRETLTAAPKAAPHGTAMNAVAKLPHNTFQPINQRAQQQTRRQEEFQPQGRGEERPAAKDAETSTCACPIPSSKAVCTTTHKHTTKLL